jgi:tRNA dimethylallyltransferase
MQVYRGLPVLTNQPETPVRLVAIWKLDHEASVAEYQRLAHAAIDDVAAVGRTTVVVGGTGLYLRAALAELRIPPAVPQGRREHWERVYDRVGGPAAHALRRPSLVIGLDVPKPELERRIERRTRRMFERGVEEEVRRALGQPLSRTARQVLGLREVAELPRDEAIDAIILRTRRYGASQRKWMRRLPGVVTVAADRPPAAVADEILEVASARQRLPARRGRAAADG